MAHEGDLQSAIIAIVRADTGAAGIVPLMQAELASKTAKTAIIEWGDDNLNKVDRPVIAVHVGPANPGRGTANRLVVEPQLDVFVERASGGLLWDLMDRLEEILTFSNFDGQGIDVAPFEWGRNKNPALVEGESRGTMRGEVWLTR